MTVLVDPANDHRSRRKDIKQPIPFFALYICQFFVILLDLGASALVSFGRLIVPSGKPFQGAMGFIVDAICVQHISS